MPAIIDLLKVVAAANILVSLVFMAVKIHSLEMGMAYMSKMISQVLIEICKRENPADLEPDTLSVLELLEYVSTKLSDEKKN